MNNTDEYMARIDVLISKGLMEPELREQARLAYGDGGKKPHTDEAEVGDNVKFSVVTTAVIDKSELFTDANLTIKRPGTGIPANDIINVKGYIAARKLSVDHVLQWSDVA